MQLSSPLIFPNSHHRQQNCASMTLHEVLLIKVEGNTCLGHKALVAGVIVLKLSNILSWNQLK
jgi:hypothetical protein